MKLRDLPPVVLEAICVYEGLMILGFKSDNIWCEIAISGETDQKSLRAKGIIVPAMAN